jgi:hypothetical protein
VKVYKRQGSQSMTYKQGVVEKKAILNGVGLVSVSKLFLEPLPFTLAVHCSGACSFNFPAIIISEP